MGRVEYYAHFDRKQKIAQTLVEHIHTVAIAACNAVSPSVDFPAIPNSVLRKIAWWTGYFHDLGKYTDYFQDYLVHGVVSDLKQHAHISAIYLHGRVLDLMKSAPEPQRSAVAFLAYLVARYHHRSLSLSRLFPQAQENMLWATLEALADHLENKAEEVWFNSKLNEVLSLDDFRRIGNPRTRRSDTGHFLYAPKYLTGRWKDAQWYFFLLYLFSVLIDVDKLDSAGANPRIVTPLSHLRVQTYLAKKSPHPERIPLNIRRNEARMSMLSRLNALSDESIRTVHFFTITAPTGIGKTLASLECALRLQERVHEIEGYTPRIVLAIPFINIIEQTRRDYERVLAEDDDQTGRLVVHHSLTDFSFYSERQSDDETPLERLLLEVESWEGDLILTTFVQLFHSMLTGSNRMLKKIHKLAGSIVLLDEVQAIPDKYQPLIGAMLRKMGEYYGTRFILMTATQPRILEFGDQLLQNNETSSQISGEPAVELLSDYPQYFSAQQRTKLIPTLADRMDSKTFVSFVAATRGPRCSALVVVNTIFRSIEVFKALKETMLKDPNRPKVLYLSTNIIPRHRRRVIRLAQRLLRIGYPVIMVSTQTIEAGVDLDFDIGFRDLAPLESIIQSAGRVNREGKKGRYAPVYVVRLEDDGQKVYAFHHMDRTRSLLEKHKTIFEPEYRYLVEEYYDWVLKDGISDDSRRLWEEGVLKLNFTELQKFSLISRVNETVDVFVETNPVTDRGSWATRLADAYEMIMKESCEHWDFSKFDGIVNYHWVSNGKNAFFQKALLRMIRSKMSDYVIQVRRNRMVKSCPLDFVKRRGVETNLLWISPENLKKFYDPETGFCDDSGMMYLY